MSFDTSAVSALARALPSTRSNRLLILIYHRVHRRPDPMFPGEVDAQRFAWQMALLRRYCNPVALSEGIAGLRSGALPPRAVAVTFDDGYADNETIALPILQRHAVKATFFIATGFLDGGRMWNDSIIEAIRGSEVGQVNTADIGLGVLDVGPGADRGTVAQKIISAVKHLAPEKRANLVEALCRSVGATLPDDLMMTSDQVRQLTGAGMEIGAHTMTHPILRTLTDTEAEAEIRGSREALQAIVRRPVCAFAYPNGRPGDDYGERDSRLAEALGFDYALSTRWGVATAQSDRYQLPRFTPWDGTPARWLLRLLTMFGTTG